MWCTVHVCVFMIRCEIPFDPTNTVHMLYNYTYVYCICTCVCVCVHVCVLCVRIIWNSSLLNVSQLMLPQSAILP